MARDVQQDCQPSQLVYSSAPTDHAGSAPSYLPCVAPTPGPLQQGLPGLHGSSLPRYRHRHRTPQGSLPSEPPPPLTSTALESDLQHLRRQVSELAQRCLRLEGGNLQLIVTHSKVVQLAVEQRSDISKLTEKLAASRAAGRLLECQLAAAKGRGAPPESATTHESTPLPTSPLGPRSKQAAYVMPLPLAPHASHLPLRNTASDPDSSGNCCIAMSGQDENTSRTCPRALNPQESGDENQPSGVVPRGLMPLRVPLNSGHPSIKAAGSHVGTAGQPPLYPVLHPRVDPALHELRVESLDRGAGFRSQADKEPTVRVTLSAPVYFDHQVMSPEPSPPSLVRTTTGDRIMEGVRAKEAQQAQQEAAAAALAGKSAAAAVLAQAHGGSITPGMVISSLAVAAAAAIGAATAVLSMSSTDSSSVSRGSQYSSCGETGYHTAREGCNGSLLSSFNAESPRDTFPLASEPAPPFVFAQPSRGDTHPAHELYTPMKQSPLPFITPLGVNRLFTENGATPLANIHTRGDDSNSPPPSHSPTGSFGPSTGDGLSADFRDAAARYPPSPAAPPSEVIPLPRFNGPPFALSADSPASVESPYSAALRLIILSRIASTGILNPSSPAAGEGSSSPNPVLQSSAPAVPLNPASVSAGTPNYGESVSSCTVPSRPFLADAVAANRLQAVGDVLVGESTDGNTPVGGGDVGLEVIPDDMLLIAVTPTPTRAVPVRERTFSEFAAGSAVRLDDAALRAFGISGLPSSGSLITPSRLLSPKPPLGRSLPRDGAAVSSRTPNSTLLPATENSSSSGSGSNDSRRLSFDNIQSHPSPHSVGCSLIAIPAMSPGQDTANNTLSTLVLTHIAPPPSLGTAAGLASDSVRDSPPSLGNDKSADRLKFPLHSDAPGTALYQQINVIPDSTAHRSANRSVAGSVTDTHDLIPLLTSCPAATSAVSTRNPTPVESTNVSGDGVSAAVDPLLLEGFALSPDTCHCLVARFAPQPK